MGPPCKDCKDREDICHSTCEKYLEWKRNREKMLSNKHLAEKTESDVYSVRYGVKKK